MLLGHAAQRPQGVLQPLGQGHEALAAQHRMSMLEAGEGQPEVIEPVTRRHWARACSASSWAKAVPIKAETTRPSTTAGVRQGVPHEVDTTPRCQVAAKILDTAALMPSWASETTSFTPLKPR